MDGNVFAGLATISRAMRKEHKSPEEIKQHIEALKEGGYEAIMLEAMSYEDNN